MKTMRRCLIALFVPVSMLLAAPVEAGQFHGWKKPETSTLR